MKKTLRKYFIPHAENNYHPHILHTKRAIFYTVAALLCKIIVVAFVIALPAEVFMSSDILAAESQKIAVLTNNLRQQKSVAVLKDNGKLDASAAAKADDMITNGYFSHISPNGDTVASFVRHSGYRYEVVGENLAIGYATAEDVVAAWKKSPTHYANLIDKDYIDLGVSMEIGDYKGEPLVYVVQHLAAPILVTAEVAPAQTPIAPAKVATKNKPATPASTIPTSTQIVSAVPSASATPTAVLSEKIIVPTVPLASLASFDAVVGRPFWDNPVQKYLRAKQISPAIELFGMSKGVFLFASIFFALALVLSVFIEIKKQHPHIITQTLGLIGLLLMLYVA